MDSIVLTGEDCRLLLVIINNARITGADARRLVQLQDKLIGLADSLTPQTFLETPDNPGGTA